METNSNLTQWVSNLLKCRPRKINYYIQALTHMSYSNEHFLSYSYENLEFLGDSVLNFLVCEYLYKKYYRKQHEGFLTQQKIKLVQGKTLALAAKKINLDKHLLLGRGAIKERISDKILEDAFEALTAAIYLDLGLKVCRDFLSKTIFIYDKKQFSQIIDYKSMIQHALSGNGSKNIVYLSQQKENRKYLVKLYINGCYFGSGCASKKKEAEQLAAKQSWQKMSIQHKYAKK